MRAVYLTGQGDYDKLQYVEDAPVPAAGRGQVLIRVSAAGVNNTDINHRLAWYAQDDDAEENGGHLAEGVWEGGGQMRFPQIQGADACGHIVAVGPGVAEERIGERVIVDPLFRHPTAYFGAECDGAFAEFTVVPAANAYAVACDFSDLELASFPCSYSTAENLLTRASVGRDDTVLVTGASGGVGSAAVQLAKARGAEVIAVTMPEKAERLRAIGADRIHNRKQALSEGLGINAVDVVIDLVGGPEWPQLLEVMKSGARYASSGAIAGPIVSLDLRTFYFKDLSLFGCTTFPLTVFASLVARIEAGEISPLVAETYPLEQMADAQKSFLNKRHVGKIVLML